MLGYDKKISNLHSMSRPRQAHTHTLALTTTGTFSSCTSLNSWFRLASETGSNCGTSPSLCANSLTQPCHPGVWVIRNTQFKHTNTHTHTDSLIWNPFSGSTYIPAAFEMVVFSCNEATPYFWHLPSMLAFLWLLRKKRLCRKNACSSFNMLICVTVLYAW